MSTATMKSRFPLLDIITWSILPFLYEQCLYGILTAETNNEQQVSIFGGLLCVMALLLPFKRLAIGAKSPLRLYDSFASIPVRRSKITLAWLHAVGWASYLPGQDLWDTLHGDTSLGLRVVVCFFILLILVLWLNPRSIREWIESCRVEAGFSRNTGYPQKSTPAQRSSQKTQSDRAGRTQHLGGATCKPSKPENQTKRTKSYNWILDEESTEARQRLGFRNDGRQSKFGQLCELPLEDFNASKSMRGLSEMATYSTRRKARPVFPSPSPDDRLPIKDNTSASTRETNTVGTISAPPETCDEAPTLSASPVVEPLQVIPPLSRPASPFEDSPLTDLFSLADPPVSEAPEYRPSGMVDTDEVPTVQVAAEAVSGELDDLPLEVPAVTIRDEEPVEGQLPSDQQLAEGDLGEHATVQSVPDVEPIVDSLPSVVPSESAATVVSLLPTVDLSGTGSPSHTPSLPAVAETLPDEPVVEIGGLQGDPLPSRDPVPALSDGDQQHEVAGVVEVEDMVVENGEGNASSSVVCDVQSVPQAVEELEDTVLADAKDVLEHTVVEDAEDTTIENAEGEPQMEAVPLIEEMNVDEEITDAPPIEPYDANPIPVVPSLSPLAVQQKQSEGGQDVDTAMDTDPPSYELDLAMSLASLSLEPPVQQLQSQVDPDLDTWMEPETTSNQPDPSPSLPLPMAQEQSTDLLESDIIMEQEPASLPTDIASDFPPQPTQQDSEFPLQHDIPPQHPQQDSALPLQYDVPPASQQDSALPIQYDVPPPSQQEQSPLPLSSPAIRISFENVPASTTPPAERRGKAVSRRKRLGLHSSTILHPTSPPKKSSVSPQPPHTPNQNSPLHVSGDQSQNALSFTASFLATANPTPNSKPAPSGKASLPQGCVGKSQPDRPYPDSSTLNSKDCTDQELEEQVRLWNANNDANDAAIAILRSRHGTRVSVLQERNKVPDREIDKPSADRVQWRASFESLLGPIKVEERDQPLFELSEAALISAWRTRMNRIANWVAEAHGDPRLKQFLDDFWDEKEADDPEIVKKKFTRFKNRIELDYIRPVRWLLHTWKQSPRNRRVLSEFILSEEGCSTFYAMRTECWLARRILRDEAVLGSPRSRELWEALEMVEDIAISLGPYPHWDMEGVDDDTNYDADTSDLWRLDEALQKSSKD